MRDSCHHPSARGVPGDGEVSGSLWQGWARGQPRVRDRCFLPVAKALLQVGAGPARHSPP